MHWESWTISGSQQSQKRPGVLRVGHQADLQRGTGSRLTVEPAKKPRVSSHEGKIGLHVAVIECLE